MLGVYVDVCLLIGLFIVFILSLSLSCFICHPKPRFQFSSSCSSSSFLPIILVIPFVHPSSSSPSFIRFPVNFLLLFSHIIISFVLILILLPPLLLIRFIHCEYPVLLLFLVFFSLYLSLLLIVFFLWLSPCLRLVILTSFIFSSRTPHLTSPVVSLHLSN